jgi:hypothetical protein
MKDPCPTHDGEAALLLRAALAPQYMSLRRLIAQTAGLLLLRDSRRSETQDGIAVSLAALRHELAEVKDALAEADGRHAIRSLSLHRLERAAATIGRALLVMTDEVQAHPLRFDPGHMAPHRAIDLLQRARSILGSIADEHVGFVIVGFTHACCCGGRPPQARPTA